MCDHVCIYSQAHRGWRRLGGLTQCTAKLAGTLLNALWSHLHLYLSRTRRVSRVPSHPDMISPWTTKSQVGAFVACIGLLAITLVFGGAAMPAATGCIISVVHPSLRQARTATAKPPRNHHVRMPRAQRSVTVSLVCCPAVVLVGALDVLLPAARICAIALRLRPRTPQ